MQYKELIKRITSIRKEGMWQRRDIMEGDDMKPVSRKEFEKRLKEIYKEKTGKELRDGKPVEVWYGIKIKEKTKEQALSETADTPMDIGRNDSSLLRCGEEGKWIKFCLDLLEEQGFAEGIDWDTSITTRLTLEEVISALIYAEQKIEECKEVYRENEKLSRMRRGCHK